MRTKPLWCALWRNAFTHSSDLGAPPATSGMTGLCCPAFRHWRDRATKPIENDLYIHDFAAGPAIALIARGNSGGSRSEFAHCAHEATTMTMMRNTVPRLEWTMRIRRIAAFSLGIATTVLAAPRPASAVPAFARKYGVRCTVCHEAWPVLNDFGRAFRRSEE